MPEYIQHDLSGKIINKWYSVDPSVVEGLSNIIEVPRSVFVTITEYWLVDGGAPREMTQAEKDTYIAERDAAIAAAEKADCEAEDDRIVAIATSDFALAKVDTAIDNIANLADAKAFLKRLCRVIVKLARRND